MNKVALIDGDSIAYIAGYCKNHIDAESSVTRSICEIMIATGASRYELYIEEWRKDKKLFRRDFTNTYKVRKKNPSVIPFLEHSRAFMMHKWNAKIVVNYESEDVVLRRAREEREAGNVPVVCFIDKDLLQYPGEFYNYQKAEHIKLDEEEATLRLWRQVCTGDQVDTVPGIPGIGPKKAEKAIECAETAMQDAAKLYKDNSMEYENFILQYNLIKLRDFESVEMLYPMTKQEFDLI